MVNHMEAVTVVNYHSLVILSQCNDSRVIIYIGKIGFMVVRLEENFF